MTEGLLSLKLGRGEREGEHQNIDFYQLGGVNLVAYFRVSALGPVLYQHSFCDNLL